ncbi:hypothetical protein [Bradyrhizobium erythrophlei]|uniref:hypothetical protein n=1 Tax=Bradyrhizobium erythrophlei TaxID=1437360 RepID=UPI0012AB7B9B|nr:hypothetical protein [Bradyrhizobium erythrophlei]
MTTDIETQTGTRWFRDRNNLFSPLASGTGHIAIAYPNDLPNRSSTGILKKPTVIDPAWENWSLHDLQDQTTKNNLGRFSCPHATKRCARSNGFDWQRQFVMMRAWRKWRKTLPNICVKQSAMMHQDLMN